jgi:hypothetical protein
MGVDKRKCWETFCSSHTFLEEKYFFFTVQGTRFLKVRFKVLTVASMKMTAFWYSSLVIDITFQRHCFSYKCISLKCRAVSTRLHGALSWKSHLQVCKIIHCCVVHGEGLSWMLVNDIIDWTLWQWVLPSSNAILAARSFASTVDRWQNNPHSFELPVLMLCYSMELTDNRFSSWDFRFSPRLTWRLSVHFWN